MAHQRTTIRNALVALLTGATSAGSRVYRNRVYDTPTTNLPAIVVRDGPESAEGRGPRDLTSRAYIRRWNAKIEILIEATANYDTTVDDIAKQVEDLITANRSISGTATTALYLGMDEPEFEPGEKVIGKITLNYEIQYIY